MRTIYFAYLLSLCATTSDSFAADAALGLNYHMPDTSQEAIDEWEKNVASPRDGVTRRQMIEFFDGFILGVAIMEKPDYYLNNACVGGKEYSTAQLHAAIEKWVSEPVPPGEMLANGLARILVSIFPCT